MNPNLVDTRIFDYDLKQLNKMSIDKPVGAMSTYLTRLLSSKSYSNIRNLIKNPSFSERLDS